MNCLHGLLFQIDEHKQICSALASENVGAAIGRPQKVANSQETSIYMGCFLRGLPPAEKRCEFAGSLCDAPYLRKRYEDKAFV